MASLENVKIKYSVLDFWYKEFDRLTRREKSEQVGPALNRVDIFRTNDIVKHIFGQKDSTIDFRKILSGWAKDRSSSYAGASLKRGKTSNRDNAS